MPKGYSAVQYLEGELQRKLAEAREITEKADAEARQLTDDERGKVETALSEAASLKSRAKEFADNEALREQIDKLGVVQVQGGEPERKAEAAKAVTMGDAFVKSDAYTALKERGFGGRWQTEQVEVPLKAAPAGTVTEGGVTGSDVVGFIAPQYLPELRTPGLYQFPLTIADLLASGTATGGSITYPVAKTRQAPSDAVTDEGDDKPLAFFEFDSVTQTLTKLAAMVPVSEEMLEDSPAIAAYINSQLPLMIRQAEEAKLASELYAADIVGPVTGSGVEPGTPTAFDAIAEAIATVRLAGFEPDGMLVHPLDLAVIQASKSSLSGDYLGGSPWNSPQSTPWGLRTVPTPAAQSGVPLVGAFRTAQVWRKGGVRVDATNSHDDWFRKNLVAIRAEERLALAIYYPEAFIQVTLPS